MDTFRTPLTPHHQPRVYGRKRGPFFLQKNAKITIFGETYTFKGKLQILV